MTLKASSVKNTAFNLFLSTIKKNFGIIVLVTIFMLLVCPGYLLVDINNHFEFSTETYELQYMFEGLNFVLTLLSCGIAGIGCFINFNFVYSKKSGDLYFALPMTRKGLLFSRIGAAIVPAVIPTVLCYGSMGLMLLSKNITGRIADIITGALLNLLLVLMTCCITILFMVCAGSMVDLLISFFGINIGLIGVAAIFTVFCEEYLRGYYIASNDFFYSSSPFLYAFASLEKLYTSKNGFAYDIGFIIYIARVVIISAICFAATIVLFKRRKAEKCTSSYAYKGMYYVCSFIFSFAAAYILGFIFSNDIRRIFFWIFAIFGAVLGAVTFGLVSDRSFKKLKSSIIVGVCSYATIVITVIILSSGGLGYTNYIPKAENIESVFVEYDYNNSDVEYKNPEFVIALHEKILKSEEVTEVETADVAVNGIVYGDIKTDTVEISGEPYKENHSSIVRIKYKLKNGFEVNRFFWVKTKDCEKEMLAIIKSEENITALKTISNKYIGAMNIYGDIEETEDSYFDTKITREECNRIMDAYIQDLQNTNEKVLYGQDKSIYIEGTVDEQNYKHIEVWMTDDFVNTINAIKGLDLKERTYYSKYDK